ncbi:MAG: hypothetical protein ACOX5R_13675 [bacterium]|jgi:hypothetical protein
MKRFLVCMIALSVVGMTWAQNDDYEYITIFDFENEEPPQISATWNLLFDFSLDDEPVHSGNTSLILDVAGPTAPWQFSTWQFPSDIGTVDLSGTDQMEVWVYSEDGPFQMNWEFGGLNLGYRIYGEEDLGTWKRFSYWYTEENAAAFTEISSWGSFLNPAAMNGLPEGFVGVIFMDDIQARVRKETPEREYFLVNGFNTEADLANVTIPDVAVADGIETGGDITPTEGTGYLTVMLSSEGANRFTLDLSDVPEVSQYDRFHFDIYMDGVAAEGWGNFSFNVDTTVMDADGNPVNNNRNILGGSYSAVATQQWHSFSAQYGPVEDTDGFEFQTLKAEVIDPALSDPEGYVAIRLNTNGGGVDGVRLLVDNIRLSRPAGTPVSEWSIY